MSPQAHSAIFHTRGWVNCNGKPVEVQVLFLVLTNLQSQPSSGSVFDGGCMRKTDLQGHKAPCTPLCLTLKEGDFVTLRLDRPRRRRVFRKQGVSAAHASGRVVWKIVGFQFVYGQPPLVHLVSGRGKSKLRMTSQPSELVSVSDPRPVCIRTVHKEKSASVACWEVEHPYLGKVFAVRTPSLPPYVEQFRRLVKAEDRRWDWKRRIWYVNQHHRLLLEALLRLHFHQGTSCVPLPESP